MINSEVLIKLTKELVAIPSISSSKNSNGYYQENAVAKKIFSELKKRHLSTTYLNLKDGRKTVMSIVKGTTKKSIVLIAHHDTVGIDDMVGLDPFNVDKNAKNNLDNRFLYGRGTGDMKSGIAVGIELMGEIKKLKLKTNVIFISAPDEENNSDGIIAGINTLLKLKTKNNFEYIGCINLDSGLQDENHLENQIVISGGTIGKILPCFYVVGKSTHASEPFAGLSSTQIASSIIKEFDSNPAYCDINKATMIPTPPPACLKNIDIKDEYSTQLATRSFLYFNYHTYGQSPKDVQEVILNVAKKALKTTIKNQSLSFEKYEKLLNKKSNYSSPDGSVYMYEDLLKKLNKINKEIFYKKSKKILANKNMDFRDKSCAIVNELSKLIVINEPYIVCFFCPPFYPSSKPSNSKFNKIFEEKIIENGKKFNINFKIDTFCDGISDMNYLQTDLDKVTNLKSYQNNNPIPSSETNLDVNKLLDISMPITCFGPAAYNPHQKNEKVAVDFTFSKYPSILINIIKDLQAC